MKKKIEQDENVRQCGERWSWKASLGRGLLNKELEEVREQTGENLEGELRA